MSIHKELDLVIKAAETLGRSRHDEELLQAVETIRAFVDAEGEFLELWDPTPGSPDRPGT